MTVLQGTEQFGTGDQTTTEAPAVDCPHCSELIFAHTVGEVTCGNCDQRIHAHDHRGEPCTAVECDSCGEGITFIQEHRNHFADWEGYFCHNCRQTLAIETAEGPQSIDRVLSTDWIFADRGIDTAAIAFGNSTWMKPTETSREELATSLLNTEAKTNHRSFHAYIPENTDAYLCFTDEYCIGYITWNSDGDHPELGQLYLLPAFRRQGIGSGFVEAWRDDVAGSGDRFSVNNPNANTYRLLRSIGAIQVTDEGVEFPGCDITGHSIDLPEEWRPGG